MSDQERELTAQQEAEVSRLLADARATEPLPADVAARLDRVLVGLGEERDARPTARPARGPSVVELAARRRRTAASLLVAAAAVVVVGVGVGQLVDRTSGSDDSAADGGAVSREAEDGLTAGSPEAHAEEEPGAGAPSSPPSYASAVVGRVSSDQFAADAEQLRGALPSFAAQGEFVELDASRVPNRLVDRGGAFTCAAARWGEGALVPVLFDGTPAVLAYRPPDGDTQVVVLLQCGTGDDLRSTTLPAD